MTVKSDRTSQSGHMFTWRIQSSQHQAFDLNLKTIHSTPRGLNSAVRFDQIKNVQSSSCKQHEKQHGKFDFNTQSASCKQARALDIASIVANSDLTDTVL